MKIIFGFFILFGSVLVCAEVQPTGKCIVLENISITNSELKFFGEILKVRMDQSSPIALKATDLIEM